MIVRVHRPTHILAEEGLHEVTRAEALRLVSAGVATIAEIVPAEDPEPAPEEAPKPKKKTTRKKKPKKEEPTE